MIYANTNMDEVPSCSIPTQEVKTIGIFEQMNETSMILTEIMYMLDTFKREIRNYPVPKDECKAIEPTCFRDAVTMVNEKAFAIKGDLDRILAEFH